MPIHLFARPARPEQSDFSIVFIRVSYLTFDSDSYDRIVKFSLITKRYFTPNNMSDQTPEQEARQISWPIIIVSSGRFLKTMVFLINRHELVLQNNCYL